MIVARHIQFSRGSSVVLDDVSFALPAGNALSILGANGAGKSTLLSCIFGFVQGWRGEIRIDGQDAKKLSRRDMARVMAYVPQSTSSAFAYSVEQCVMMGRTAYLDFGARPTAQDRAAVERALMTVGIAGFAARPFNQLSHGEQQLVILARALSQETPIIVLDEPTASLDLSNQGRVLSIVRRLVASGRTVLMTTHLPEHAFLLRSRVALLKQGRIVATGTPAETCTGPLLSDLYGARVQVLSGIAEGGDSIAICLPSIDDI